MASEAGFELRRSRRMKKLTGKAFLLYSEKVRNNLLELATYREEIKSLMHEFVSEHSETKKTEISVNLHPLIRGYETLSNDFETYLTRTGTEESELELCTHKLITEAFMSRFERTMGKTIQIKRNRTPSVVQSSSSKYRSLSHSSQNSSKCSERVMKQLAETEAARVRLKFTQREANLKKETAMLEEQEVVSNAKSTRKRSDLNTELDVLRQERDAAEAEARLEAFVHGSGDQGSSRRSLVFSSVSNIDRTEDYVQEQYRIVANTIPENGHSIKQELLEVDPEYPQRTPRTPYAPMSTASSIERADQGVSAETTPGHQGLRTSLSATAKPYHPPSAAQINAAPNTTFTIDPTPSVMQSPPQTADIINNFTNYLLKKDLIMARFTTFNDSPVMYSVWKRSFTTIVLDIQVNPQEEMDLLIKWLGPESSKYALSLSTSNAHNPARGLERIWSRLDERYGAPELVESTLKSRIATFPRILPKDYKKLYELADVLAEVESLKDNPKYSALLGYYDTSSGINPVVIKLPQHLQNKWMDRAQKYKQRNSCTFPPFSFFVSFINEIATHMNDSSFTSLREERQVYPQSQPRTNYRTPMVIRKTEVNGKMAEKDKHPPQTNGTTSSLYSRLCPLHKTSHSLNDCKTFSKQPIEERRLFFKQHSICYKCGDSDRHIARNCEVNAKCCTCGSNRHPTSLHDERPMNTRSHGVREIVEDHGGEHRNVTALCTMICGEGFHGKSCAKTLMVNVFPKGNPEHAVTVYAILDDQSNRTLASPELLDALGVEGPDIRYTLSSCAGDFSTSGRRAHGFIVRSTDGVSELELPTMVECSEIPSNHTEIATPEVARYYGHMKEVADCIPPLDPDCQIGLLIGRDLIDAHHVLKQLTGPPNAPFAQKLTLGWVIIGDVCLGKVHEPPTGEDRIRSFKTHVLHPGRNSIFQPCSSKLMLKEHYSAYKEHKMMKPTYKGDELFIKCINDEKIGLSVEDREFIDIMDGQFEKDSQGNWTAPLPFRANRQKLPNNRFLALKRAKILDANLQKNATKKEHFVTFMQKVLDTKAAEVAPPAEGEVWYLPIFGVYHPKKPDRIRGVFDSSATCEGVSLNSTLLSGPNLTNSLLGILLRFRKDAYAITADIEQMFYSFLVKEDHRNFLRFLWYRDNNPDLDLIEYRMRVHVFGNSPSPAVATYGLRKSVEHADDDVKLFVHENFYVDDALTSQPTVEKTVSIMKRTQAALKQEGNIRLHKITSNSLAVMNAFPEEDLGKELKAINLDKDPLPTHQSLGLLWDLNEDSFGFTLNLQDKPNTRRGFLSTLNGIYDPLGFIAPMLLQGKILMREIAKGTEWDETLNPDLVKQWKFWTESLQELEKLSIPRMFIMQSLSMVEQPELHIFSDASEKAVSAVAYLKTEESGDVKVGFVMGKSKLAPSHGHTIPRLELCAAVLATEIGEIIGDNLSISLDKIIYHTDSRVVLGYLNNKTRRFFNYVANRVERILRTSKAGQWSYVPTKENPADHGTRGLVTVDLLRAKWIAGPKTLLTVTSTDKQEIYPLVTPENDAEVRVEVHKTTVNETIARRFQRFSNWHALVNAITLLKQAARKFKCRHGDEKSSPEIRKESEQFILRCDQLDFYCEEVMCLRNGKRIPDNSTICMLSPYLDHCGIMRVGGRLNQSSLPLEETNPVILSSKSHMASLIVRKFHENVRHQGRLLTEGAVRNNGYWIVGAKRLISSMLHSCVTCRRLRGTVQQQRMADLPADRLTPGPPFTSVGVDAFGPWTVVTRRTRGGSANSKRWAILFTCLTTRAVHIEVVEEMSSSSFINALRRFVSLRGIVKELRSDRGTNFIGATDALQVNVINVEDGSMAKFLHGAGVTWIFNAPHSSHMGGVWERMIGIARRILDAMLLDNHGKSLTHEVLVTFMAEVCAIMNSRPVASISTDPTSPMILSPATLLNQKVNGGQMLCQELDTNAIYREHWKQVQVLSDMFWRRWKEGYMHSLQIRRKWTAEQPNVKNGDVVLLKDKSLPRGEWSTGIIVNAIQSKGDNRVRKAEVRVSRNGRCATYTRPVTEMIILLDT